MNSSRGTLQYSPTLSGIIGLVAAIVYDYIIRLIFHNYSMKYKTAYEGGKWWTFANLDYYVNAFGGGISKRNFQHTVAFLVEKGYLQLKHKGRAKIMWFALGDKVPNIPTNELPLQGKFFDTLRGLKPKTMASESGLKTNNAAKPDNKIPSADKDTINAIGFDVALPSQTKQINLRMTLSLGDKEKM